MQQHEYLTVFFVSTIFLQSHRPQQRHRFSFYVTTTVQKSEVVDLSGEAEMHSCDIETRGMDWLEERVRMRHNCSNVI